MLKKLGRYSLEPCKICNPPARQFWSAITQERTKRLENQILFNVKVIQRREQGVSIKPALPMDIVTSTQTNLMPSLYRKV